MTNPRKLTSELYPLERMRRYGYRQRSNEGYIISGASRRNIDRLRLFKTMSVQRTGVPNLYHLLHCLEI